jgi:large subunit ribosomal protein L3
MVTGIIGRKIGMTQVFAPDGTVTPATVVKAGPCVVLQAKGTQTDGYEAVQLGFVEEKPIKVNKALGGHYKKAGNVPPTRMRREVKSAPGPADEAPLKAGDQVLVGGVFNDGDRIDVIGISRGKGFQGVMKRHNFAGGAATHGSMFHRAPGSIGASSFPSRVVKGMRAAGRMGGDRVTVRNLRIVKVDGENNLLLIRGAVPGSPGTYLIVRKAITAKKEAVPQVEKAGKMVAKKPAAKPAAKGKK